MVFHMDFSLLLLLCAASWFGQLVDKVIRHSLQTIFGFDFQRIFGGRVLDGLISCVLLLLDIDLEGLHFIPLLVFQLNALSFEVSEDSFHVLMGLGI